MSEIMWRIPKRRAGELAEILELAVYLAARPLAIAPGN
jgi:hypothetical protein